MKKLAYLSFGTLALVGVLLFATNGCGARGKVAVNKLTSAVDKMLGELDVKKQKIDDKMKALEEGVAEIRKSKTETSVQKEMLEKKINDEKADRDEIDSNLKKIKGLLETAKSANSDKATAPSGKEIETSKLELLADELIQKRKTVTAKLEGFEKVETMLARVVKSLEAKEKEYSETSKKLKNAMTLIEAKTEAAKTLQAASKSIDGNDNMKSSVDKLESEIEELDVMVETSLRLEDDKWAKSKEANDLEDAKSFLETSGGASDKISEIDALLNGKE